MDIEKIASNVKILLDLDANDNDKIYILVRKSILDIKLKYNIEEIPDNFSSVIEDLVIYRWNTSIGLNSETLGDRNVSYTEGIPKEILERLRYLKKVRFY